MARRGQPCSPAGAGPPQRRRSPSLVLAVAALVLLAFPGCLAQAGTSTGLLRKLYPAAAGSCYDAMPWFDTLAPAETIVVPTVDYACRLETMTEYQWKHCFSGTWGECVALMFEGTLVVPASGSYELFLNSDDGAALYIDGYLVVDNDGGPHVEREVSATVYMRAGCYPLRIEWFNQRRHAIVQFKWQSSDLGIPKQIVPSSQLRPSNPANPAAATFADGLNMTAYWSGSMPAGFGNYTQLAPHQKIQKLVPQLDCWPFARCFSPYETNVWAKFEGYINFPTAGTYTFYLASDDGSRLAIDNVTVVDNGGFHAMLEKNATRQFTAGWHPIQVEFFQGCCVGGLRVWWSGPTFDKKILANPFIANKPPLPAMQVCSAGQPCLPLAEAAGCEAGRTLVDGVCKPCPAGSSCPGGLAPPAECPVGTYAADSGMSECSPCPDYSYAHFPGSTGCIACYFGEPKVVAGRGDGFWPYAMPAEQAREGFRAATMVAGLDSCTFTNPFKAACASTAGRTIAFETHQSCLVRMYVLSDPGCSDHDNLTIVDGAYRNIYDIETLPGDTSGPRVVARTAGAGMSLTFADPNNAGQSCTTALSMPPSTATDAVDNCPVGTRLQVHSQNTTNPYVPVFKYTACEPCPTGSTCAGGMNGAAMQCPAGKYTELLGATACSACPNGTAALLGATTCQECAPGTEPSADRSTCQLCPAGTYNKLPGSPCIKCKPGSYRSAEGGDGTECTPCPPGTFAFGEGASECTPCAAGTVSEAEGATACSACPAGSFSAVAGGQECNACEPGSFSNSTGAANCTLCGAGMNTINTNGEGATSCSLCPRGTYKTANATDNKCQSCPSGYATLKNEGANSCTACPVGQYASAPNSVNCTLCEPGKYADQTASKSCKPCAAGFVSTLASGLPAQGQPGWLGNATQAGGTRCTACPYRTFRPSIYAANSCTACPTGRETKLASGASVCTACIPGTVLLFNATANRLSPNCTACPAGSFTAAPGASMQCTACPAGSAVSHTGNQACDICAPGTYQNATGAFNCIECPAGTYSEMTGAKSLADCKPAPAGNYADGSGNDGFTPCLAGTYQDKPGQGMCKECPPGFACPAGSVNPKPCSAGFFADMKQPFCRECPKGQYQDQAKQRACKPCPAGAYCPNTKTITPVKCPAGTFNKNLGSATATSCAKCPVNSFTNAAGQQSCKQCGSGTWTGRLTGQKQCWSTSSALPPAGPSGRR